MHRLHWKWLKRYLKSIILHLNERWRILFWTCNLIRVKHFNTLFCFSWLSPYMNNQGRTLLCWFENLLEISSLIKHLNVSLIFFTQVLYDKQNITKTQYFIPFETSRSNVTLKKDDIVTRVSIESNNWALSGIAPHWSDASETGSAQLPCCFALFTFLRLRSLQTA